MLQSGLRFVAPLILLTLSACHPADEFHGQQQPAGVYRGYVGSESATAWIGENGDSVIYTSTGDFYAGYIDAWHGLIEGSLQRFRPWQDVGAGLQGTFEDDTEIEADFYEGEEIYGVLFTSNGAADVDLFYDPAASHYRSLLTGEYETSSGIYSWISVAHDGQFYGDDEDGCYYDGYLTRPNTTAVGTVWMEVDCPGEQLWSGHGIAAAERWNDREFVTLAVSGYGHSLRLDFERIAD